MALLSFYVWLSDYFDALIVRRFNVGSKTGETLKNAKKVREYFLNYTPVN
jgi:hypothetical protein